MMFPLMIPMIGAGIGALTNKKNPLQGAILGGGLGALGGAAAPAISGMFGSAAPAAGAMGPFMPIEGAPLLDAGGEVIKSSGPTGLLGLMDTAKPVGQAFSAAGGLLGNGSSNQVQSHAPQVGNGGELSQLYASIQQGDAQAGQFDLQNRAKQQELLKRFGGSYGAA